jgi:hypothetical protein
MVFPFVAVAIQIAVAIGTSLLMRALTPTTKVEGPRLQDLKGTDSSYGGPIPKCFGLVRLGGQCIWQLPIIEESRTQKVGKGGGGSRITNYSYYWTGAILLGEGLAVKLLRVWGDTKLLINYDGQVDGSGIGQDPSFNDLMNAVLANRPGVTWRFYFGTEDQMPDPAIVADVDARLGEGSTPAYRGRCYIVFERLPLKDFGNRVPQFSFEVLFDGETQSQFIEPTYIDDGLEGAYGFMGAINWATNSYYTVDRAGDVRGIRKFRTDTNVQVGTAGPELYGGYFDLTPTLFGIYAPTDGQLYINTGTYMSRLDPDTMAFLDAINTTDISTTGAHAVAQYWGGGIIGVRDYMATTIRNGGLQIWRLQIDAPPLLINQYDISDDAGDPVVGAASIGYDLPVFYAAGTASGTVNVYKIVIEKVNELLSYESVIQTTLRNLTFSDYATALGDPSVTGIEELQGIVVDYLDGCPIVSVGLDRGASASIYCWAKIDKDTGEILWAAQGGRETSSATLGLSLINGMMVMGGITTQYARYDTTTGNIIEEIPFGDIDYGDANGSVNDFYAYNYIADATVGLVATQDSGPLFFSRANPNGVSLGYIVSQLCYRGGLVADDLDVTELTDMVTGYVVGSNMSIRDAITPLTQAYFFDGCESDYKLKFRKFGQASSQTIEQQDVGLQDGKTIIETREQEADLPEQVTFAHFDPLRDEQSGTQTAKRISNPHRTGYTRSQINVTLPLVATPSTVKAIAQRSLYSRWVERDSQSFKLPRPFLVRDPLDAVVLDLDDHDIKVRIQEATVGADLSMEVRSVAEEPALFGLDADADGGYVFPQLIPTPTGPMRLFLIDGPYMRDVDVGSETFGRVYFASSPVASGSTAGAYVFETQNPEGTSWETVGSTVTAPNMGALTAALAAPESPDRTDEGNSITLRVWRGTPENVTTLEMRQGANPLIILDRDTNNVEYAQYRDAVQNADGTWTLSFLRRGLRGTDGMPMTFDPGDFVIFPETTTLTRFSVPISELDSTHYFKAVPSGGLFDQQPTYQKDLVGRELMPYAPVGLEAVLDGADIDLSWKRRTRFNGEWLDGEGDVPLNEETEEYEVEIYDDDTYSTVLRTLESATTAVTYTAADIATDFGGTPTQIHAKIYQLGQIGRGFARELIAEVA